MAFTFKFSAHEAPDSKSIDINDLTGLYSLSNLTGYQAEAGDASGNPKISEVVSAEIKVTNPSGTVYTIDAYPTLPNTTEAPFNIANTLLGVDADTVIPDGIYYIEYTIATSSETYTTNSYTLLFNQMEALVQRLFEKVTLDDDSCLCESELMERAMEASALLCAAYSAAACGKKNKATTIINYLTKLTDCGLN